MNDVNLISFSSSGYLNNFFLCFYFVKLVMSVAWNRYELFSLCRVVVNAEAPYIKMVSEQFDRCHGTLLQYVDFLCSAVTPTTAYAQLIPSLNDLVHMYHLDPEVSLSHPRNSPALNIHLDCIFA